DHDERPAQHRTRHHSLLNALIRHKGRNAKIDVIARSSVGSVVCCIDRWRNHPAVPAVAATDPLPDGLRYRDEMRDPGRACSEPVPSTHPIQKKPYSRPSNRVCVPGIKIRLAPLPGIAHRCETITDVWYPFRHTHGLGHTVAETYNQIHVARLPR